MRKHTSRWLFVVLAAGLAVMPLALATQSYAQTSGMGTSGGAGTMPGASGMPGGSGPGMMGGPGSMRAPSETTNQVQGAIQTIDPSGRSLTLADGTELTIPPTVNVPRGMLKEGTIVKANYEEKAGQKVVTSLEIQQP